MSLRGAGHLSYGFGMKTEESVASQQELDAATAKLVATIKQLPALSQQSLMPGPEVSNQLAHNPRSTRRNNEALVEKIRKKRKEDAEVAVEKWNKKLKSDCYDYGDVLEFLDDSGGERTRRPHRSRSTACKR